MCGRLRAVSAHHERELTAVESRVGRVQQVQESGRDLEQKARVPFWGGIVRGGRGETAERAAPVSEKRERARRQNSV
jgi:hypothetical protein